MKFLFDLFPIILFFIVFKLYGIYEATAAAILATLAQVGWAYLKSKKIEKTLWINLGLIVVFGGATLLLRDETFIKWKNTWRKRIKLNNKPLNEVIDLMRSVNPLVIPRNHKIEEALEAAELNDMKPINKILEILKNPYDKQSEIIDYQYPSKSSENYQTFCGT